MQAFWVPLRPNLEFVKGVDTFFKVNQNLYVYGSTAVTLVGELKLTISSIRAANPVLSCLLGDV